MTLDQLRQALHTAVAESNEAKQTYGETSTQYCLAMEEVEELSVALHDRKQDQKPTLFFENFCRENPSEAECKVFDL